MRALHITGTGATELFKPYKPKRRNGHPLRHELQESFKEHLVETVGIPKGMRPPKRRR